MKHFIFLIGLLLPLLSQAQSSEFNVDSGYIYSQHAISHLRKISDSLNLKYRLCNTKSVYTSVSQTKVRALSFWGKNSKLIKKAIESGEAFEKIHKRFPKSTYSEQCLALLTNSQKEGYNISTVVINSSDISIDLTIPLEEWNNKNNRPGSVFFDFEKEGQFTEGYIQAIQLIDSFSSGEIPFRYAKMIQYVDCMVDTTEPKMLNPTESYYSGDLENLDTLSQAAKEILLNQLRRTQVVGNCSMDPSPRIHAKNIAIVSAESGNWRVFLKAHLDILNDKFERVSDGSYAHKERKTYIKELEALNLDLPALMTGIIIRINDPSPEHYYGSPARIGRAISESKDSLLFESLLESVIADSGLDDFNRLLHALCFDYYQYYKASERSKKRFQAALTQLPPYLSTKFKEN